MHRVGWLAGNIVGIYVGRKVGCRLLAQQMTDCILLSATSLFVSISRKEGKRAKSTVLDSDLVDCLTVASSRLSSLRQLSFSTGISANSNTGCGGGSAEVAADGCRMRWPGVC
jgi:hypothetical protein